LLFEAEPKAVETEGKEAPKDPIPKVAAEADRPESFETGKRAILFVL